MSEFEWLKESVRLADTGRYEDRIVLSVFKMKKVLAEWETQRRIIQNAATRDVYLARALENAASPPTLAGK